LKSTIICGAFVFVCGIAQASDWRSLGKSADGDSESFVDRATIAVVGNVRGALFKYVPKHHLDMYRREWIERSEAFSEYDCKRNTVHAMQRVIYLEGGGTHTEVLPAAWGKVIAPWDQVALKFLCAWQGE
jgi:hypothetical protein